MTQPNQQVPPTAEEVKKQQEAKVKTEAEEKKKAEAKVKTEAEEKARLEAEKAEKLKRHKGKYDRYTDLKFIELDGGKLKEPIKKELGELEEELKDYPGKKGKVTKTRACGAEIVKIVEGIPLPDEYYKILKAANRTGKDEKGNYKDCE